MLATCLRVTWKAWRPARQPGSLKPRASPLRRRYPYDRAGAVASIAFRDSW